MNTELTFDMSDGPEVLATLCVIAEQMRTQTDECLAEIRSTIADMSAVMLTVEPEAVGVLDTVAAWVGEVQTERSVAEAQMRRAMEDVADLSDLFPGFEHGA